MNGNGLEIVQLILSSIIIVFISILKKYWNSFDSFLNEKAKNYATKEDVITITTKTEEVQNEFKKALSQFDADLQFKYSIYEKQYINLYSELYYFISCSEAIKSWCKYFKDELDLSNIPIAEYQDDDKLLSSIINIIHENCCFASPKLINVVNQIEMFNKHNKVNCLTNDCDKIKIKLKQQLVTIILHDYNWLREQLKLPIIENVEEKIENTKLIEFEY